MEKITRFSLSGEKETLFITLRAKALDSRSEHSLLHDDMAYWILQSVNYDFDKYSKSNDGPMVIRARQFDEWVREYINDNRDAAVVHIGCGLDTRITRIAPPNSVSWYDLDFPEVIQIRKFFYSEKGGYRMLASSAVEDEWLAQIPANRNALIIAEGVLEYFTFEEVKTLFNRLLVHFEKGEIIFDVMNGFAIRLGKKALRKTTGAQQKWAVNDTSIIDSIHPRLTKITELSVTKSECIQELPHQSQKIYKFMFLVPLFRNMLRMMRYQFIGEKHERY